MLLQLSAQLHLGAVLPTRAVVGQDEVRVAVVEHGQFVEGVGHGLVRLGHLQGKHTGVRHAWTQRHFSVGCGNLQH